MDDIEVLTDWWNSLLSREPPPPTVRGLWFGLFNDSQGGVTLYVHGFDHVDVEDRTAEWATEEPTWAPQSRYVRVPVLTRSDDWERAQTAARELLSLLRPWSRWPGHLGAVAIGFDDGDAQLIWPLADC